MTPLPDRVPLGSSRAVSPVAGHGVRDGRRVPYRPSPDRVPYGLSPDRVASRPCRVHSPASRRPVVCHTPAQQRREPTPLPAVYEHLFFSMSVAFNHGSVGGAAKANRWAARIP